MDKTSQRTHDREEIREWVEKRGGRPARVKGSAGKGGGGLLRIDFGEKDEKLEEISWDEFFEIFEDSNLDFLYQEETKEGGESRFNKFVNREE